MKINQENLIDELIGITNQAIEEVKEFKKLSTEQLNYKENPTSWSILECCEHLNLYGDFYLPEMQRQLIAHPAENKSFVFKTGILGNYFANLMKPNKGQVKKMNAPKDKNPVNSELSVITLDRQLKQLELLKQLLHQSRNVNLVKAKTPISISKHIKLRLGDTFRFFTYHIERHIAQAKKVETD